MKYLSVPFVALALLSASESYSESIPSLPTFEKNIKQCMSTFSAKNKCVSELIKAHLPEGNESIMPVADQVESIFAQWLSEEKVENVYNVYRKEIGEFMINQKYIIEDSTASTILFEITYRKALGEWYVLNFNINSKPEYIKAQLGY